MKKILMLLAILFSANIYGYTYSDAYGTGTVQGPLWGLIAHCYPTKNIHNNVRYTCKVSHPSYIEPDRLLGPEPNPNATIQWAKRNTFSYGNIAGRPKLYWCQQYDTPGLPANTWCKSPAADHHYKWVYNKKWQNTPPKWYTDQGGK